MKEYRLDDCDMKRIMILGASILQLPAIQKAKELGLEVIAVDMDPKAIGFKEADINLVISTIDIPNVVNAAEEYQIDGVMTLASDMPMRTVAAIAKKLGLIGITDDTALKATNKVMMRQALSDYGVPIPKFYKVSNEEEYLAAVKEIEHMGYRCIIKPADNSGSRGVDLLESFDEETIKAAYKYSRTYSRNGDVIVEEYMEGPEVSVETLSVKGKCYVIQITDKLTTGAPYFVEMGHNQPSKLSPEMCERIEEVAIAANKAVGITDGPSHTEIKVTADGPKIVELGARLGGDNITTHLVPLSTGVDMVECCIRIALGEEPDIIPTFHRASAIRYIRNDVGVIEEISGLEEAKSVPGVKQISIVHGVGEVAKEIQSSVDRIGFVIAQENTVKGAIDACEKALEKINVKIRK